MNIWYRFIVFLQMFYLYLYVGSLVFMIYMYATLLRDRTVYSMVSTYSKTRVYIFSL